jgi:hypothetical protein
MQELLTTTTGQAEYRHTNGVLSKVRIEAVGLGLRKVRIANLPPKVDDRNKRMALRQFGEIRDIRSDTWSQNYRYLVSNGIRITPMNLAHHIPSHLMVAGHRTLISYERQPTTCLGCNEIGRIYQVCPHRRRKGAEEAKATRKSWAEVATTGAASHMDTIERSDRGEEVVERAAVSPDVAEGTNTEPQEWNQSITQRAMDLMSEARQLTEPVEGSRDTTGQLGEMEEHQVGSATEGEEDEMRVEEVAVEEQMMITQSVPGQKQRKSKRGNEERWRDV